MGTNTFRWGGRSALIGCVQCLGLVCLNSCKWLTEPNESCLTSHGIVRKFRVFGAADTLYVGDTVRYEGTMLWEGAADNITGEPTDLNVRRVPTLTWPVYLYASYAPLGPIPDSLLPERGPARSRFGFTPGTVTPDAERSVTLDGGRTYTLYADTLQSEWRLGVRITFDQPGRYLVGWRSGIDDSPYVDVTRGEIPFYDNPDQPGCRQQLIITNHLVGYENNEVSVARAEAASNVPIRTSVPENVNAFYYVIVLDEP